ncbi:MAG: hypothetical protein L7F77_05420 [Candidatus Magnetominusculus sp. LBB02]|nr:hypothetical protein [Candidatus Magnetominusculus sp. LBB02]
MRPFYIIGHNPNTVSDAMNCFRAGANAIEPDVHFTNGDFYMGEGTTSRDLSLADYLKGLTLQLSVSPSYVPALIAFDTKNSTGNILAMFKCIQDNYSSQYEDTAIVVTRSQATADEHVFFQPARLATLPKKFAVGVDEYTQPEYADVFYKSLEITNYTYADGISIQLPFLSRIFFWKRIEEAVSMRDKGDSFKMVYSWTLDLQEDIEAFLKLNVDGLITDSPGMLRKLIASDPFSKLYRLATVEDNPFK